MELRKDPITRSWVITGDDAELPQAPAMCPFCPDAQQQPQVISTAPGGDGQPWAARAVVHPTPLYHVEGDPQRRGDGLYDKMRTLGAHEILVQTPKHGYELWDASDAEIEAFLRMAAQRVVDLKRDRRLKYISLFKDFGPGSGQIYDHPHFELVATAFVPRRVLYELRSGREYFQQKERCVFCDIIALEEQKQIRVVDQRGDYIAMCPYAPRVPYETWILPRSHHHSFEHNVLGHANVRDLSALLRRTLKRIRSVSDGFHMVLHSSPNEMHRSEVLNYWKTIEDDYHFHFEILPILKGKPKSYTFKEVYFTPVSSETAAARLRDAAVGE